MMLRSITFLFVIACSFGTLAHAQTETSAPLSWTHQIGVEIGPQYAFDASVKSSNGQTLTLKDVGLGFGAAINYYYRFDHRLFLSVSGVLGIFGNGYFRRQNADGTFPILNSFYFKDNALLNLALTAGLRYNFALSGLQPYVGLEVGSYSIGGIPNDEKQTPINLAATPKVGFRYPLAPGLDFDASAKAMVMFSGYVPFSYASVNVGVSYALNLAK